MKIEENKGTENISINSKRLYKKYMKKKKRKKKNHINVGNRVIILWRIQRNE